LTIKKFLSESNGNVVLTKGEKEISDFKRAARMDDDGAREHFEDTDVAALNIKKYEKDETKFIRSRLPAAKALKIGASGLKLKPLRLVLTILLSFVAFVMFGLFSTMMVYDNDEVLTNTFMESDYEYIALAKNYNARVSYQYSSGETYTYDTTRSTNFTPAELEKFSAVAGEAFGTYNGNFGSPANVSIKPDLNIYYDPSISKLAVCSDNHPFASKLTAGEFPKNKKDICVSSYFLDCLKNGDFRVVDENGAINGTVTTAEIRSAEDLIGKYVSFYQSVFRVSGVFNSGEIPAKYDDLKSGDGNFLTASTYRTYLEQSPHAMAFVSEEYVNENLEQLTASNEYVEYFQGTAKRIRLTDKNNTDPNYNIYTAYSLCALSPDTENVLPLTFFGTQKTQLEDDELIVPLECLANFSVKSPNHDDYFHDDMTDEEWNAANDAYNAAWDEYNENYQIFRHAYEIAYYGTVTEYEYADEGNTTSQTNRPATNTEIAEAVATLKAYFVKNSDLLQVEVYLDEYEYVGEMKIVGFYASVGSYYYSGLYCGQELYDRADVYVSGDTIETKYEREDDAYF
ncbi:MAG: hypothetical protein K2J30_04225, partial [Clostridia bacterium]|nr:hypothetical protein [Clostridia bacterium]